MKIDFHLSIDDLMFDMAFHQGKIFDDRLHFHFSIKLSFFKFFVSYNDRYLIAIFNQSDFDYKDHWQWIKHAYLNKDKALWNVKEENILFSKKH